MPPIHVRYWAVDLSGPIEASDWAVLNSIEQARARRFVHAHHAARFVIARAALRRALGLATGQLPAEVAIVEAIGGRPELDGAGAPRFNVSHSGELAVIALCGEAAIGVDVEHRRPIEKELVERFFSWTEQQGLAGLTEADWLTGFYRCWTRKEAFVKGLGEGLMLPLDRFDVSLGETPRLLRCDFAPAGDWTLVTLPTAPAYEAVAAVEARGRPVTVEEFPAAQIRPHPPASPAAS